MGQRSLLVAALAAAAAGCGGSSAPIIDGAVADGRADAAPTDGGLPDGGLPDGGLPDAGGSLDGGLPDAGGPLDGGLPDSGLPLTLSAASPTDGLAVGGTTVTVRGTGLTAATSVTFAGVAAACTLQSPTAMTCTTGAAIGPRRGPIVATNASGGATAPQPWTYTGVANETDLPTEVAYCNLQFPATITATTGAATPTIYGQVYQPGVTEAAGAPLGVVAELGWGPAGADPTTDVAWRFVATQWNVQVGNNDEFQASLIAPATGDYRYTYRVSLDDGLTFTYCDLDGAGANAGLIFSSNQLGVLTVAP
ncbi:MAG: IPT/TIG domain-containing protein [Kofleriaceae bacterium]